MKFKFFIGQRVIIDDYEIGVVEAGGEFKENQRVPNDENDMWVFSPSKGYASMYAVHNLKPLPEGQL